MIKHVLFLLVFLTVSEALLANTSYYRRPVYKDLRILGRGNAGVAVVDDGAALFYNPAGLGRGKRFIFEFVNPGLGVSASAINNVSAVSSIGGSSQSLAENFDPFLGKPLAVDGAIYPNLAVPYLAVGTYFILDSRIEYRNPVSPEFSVRERDDTGVIIGSGFEIYPGLSIGASLRWNKRRTIEADFTGSSLLSLSTNSLTGFSKRGTGYGFNVGAQYRVFPLEGHVLSIGAAVEDLGNTVFRSSRGAANAPDPQRMSISAGLAYEVNTPVVDVRLLFDARNIGQGNYYATGKMLHQGIELSLLGMDLRGGFYQGYWSAGFSFRWIPLLRVDFTSYAEELDSNLGFRENRMYLLGISAGINLERAEKQGQRYSLDHLESK